MVVQKNCSFVTNVNAPIVSKVFPNSTGDTLSLQITGANGKYYLEGRNNNKLDWVPLAGINLTTLSVHRGEFTTAGLYSVDVSSVREIRARVEETEGIVSLFGQIISMEET